MAHGGYRSGAGRPGWHVKAEHCLRLDVRSLARHKVLAGGIFSWRWTNSYTGEETGSIGLSVWGDSLRLKFSIGGKPTFQDIAVTRTPCHYGGTRPWLACPHCQQRIGVLFLRGGAFKCRRCADVRYSSQSEDAMGRAWRLQHKLEAKLGENWTKPSGMHHGTRAKLLERIFDCERARDDALAVFLSRHTGLLDDLGL